MWTHYTRCCTDLCARYKKLEEQKEEKRASYVEKEVFIEKPVAPPRVKKGKRQSFKGFKEERQALFQVLRIYCKLYCKLYCPLNCSPTTPPRTGWTCCR